MYVLCLCCVDYILYLIKLFVELTITLSTKKYMWTSFNFIVCLEIFNLFKKIQHKPPKIGFLPKLYVNFSRV